MSKDIDQYVKDFKEFSKEMLKSKESATQFLVDAGINNPDGTLTKRYAPEKEYIMLQQGNIFDSWELSYGRTTDKKMLLDRRDELIRLNVPKFFRGYKVFEITEVE